MGNKNERIMECGAIVVDRVDTWVETQNVLLGVRPVGNVNGKIILLASTKLNQRIEELRLQYTFKVSRVQTMWRVQFKL